MKVAVKFFMIILLTLSMPINKVHADGKTSTSGSDDATQQVTNVLCHVIDVATGNVGKLIATMVVISLAIGLFLGKVCQYSFDFLLQLKPNICL